MTGASEVVAGEEITKRPVVNITKGLQGFMPGVTVQDFGGRPGSDGATVRIRGAGTLGNNGALIIVDGVVGEINNLIRSTSRACRCSRTRRRRRSTVRARRTAS